MGAEKGLVEFNGKPMVLHVLDCIQHITPDILIVANDPAYLQFGYPVQADETKGAGPLSGLVSGIRHSHHHLNLVLPCDMPLIDEGLLHWMVEGYADQAAAVLILDDRIQPLIGLYHRRALPVLERMLAARQLRMRSVVMELKAAVLDPGRFMQGFDPKGMRNFNSRAEIDAYLQEAR
ncbi:MAG: hypothetical protein RLZZ165_731 [Bacteroidota bacterium]|jgi:molybdopterin-guanine dinucleotide biosynthesis protein A